MKKYVSFPVLVAALLLAAGLTACKHDSVVSDASAPAKSAAPQAAATQASPATASAAAPQNQQPTPSPTLHPIMKQAQAKPGVPVAVPESMRRPLNAEEMQKALQQMPPEVRARIQGMQAAPQAVRPQATPKP